jgi:hypothetical protein
MHILQTEFTTAFIWVSYTSDGITVVLDLNRLICFAKIKLFLITFNTKKTQINKTICYNNVAHFCIKLLRVSFVNGHQAKCLKAYSEQFNFAKETSSE